MDKAHALAGEAACIVSFVAVAMYLRDIVIGKASPSRVPWWVLAMLNAGLAASYVAGGARTTAWLPASYALSFLAVAFASVWRGDGAWTPWDKASLFGAGVAGAIWLASHSPVVALVAFTAVDFGGLLPTIQKAWARPDTETPFPWLLATFASALNILAIGRWTPDIALYSVYVLATNLAISFLVLRRPSSRATAGTSA